MTKITFIGAGSIVFNKNLIGDLLSVQELGNITLSLHDIDPVRLETAELLAHAMAACLGVKPKIEAHLDRRRSLEGADYAINLIGVGGHSATLIDFDIPRAYGLRQTIGDTHGIGAIFRALRTIPVMQGIVQDMLAVCPQALLLNYSNPLAMITWAVFASSPLKVVGLCHSVPGTVKALAKYTGLPYEEITYRCAGINHMAWVLRFEHQGRDAYPLLRQAYESGAIPRYDLVRADLYSHLGYYMTESSEHMAEYVPYYLPHEGEVERLNIPIDEYVRRSVKGLADFDVLRQKLLAGEPVEYKPSVEYAASIVRALETGLPAVIYGNVRNEGLIDNLPQGCCVEVPCLVDRAGLQPVKVGALPAHLAGMNRPHIAVQELVVKAALEGKREHIYHAAMLDPLATACLPLDKIFRMVDDMITAHGMTMPEGIRMTNDLVMLN